MGKEGWWIVRAVLGIVHMLLHFLDKAPEVPGTTAPQSKRLSREIFDQVIDAADVPEDPPVKED